MTKKTTSADLGESIVLGLKEFTLYSLESKSGTCIENPSIPRKLKGATLEAHKSFRNLEPLISDLGNLFQTLSSKLGKLTNRQTDTERPTDRETGNFLTGMYIYPISPTNTVVWHFFHVNWLKMRNYFIFCSS